MTLPDAPLQEIHVPPKMGRAVQVKRGDRVKVTDLQGKQVCDFFALNPSDPTEFLSGTYTSIQSKSKCQDRGDASWLWRPGR